MNGKGLKIAALLGWLLILAVVVQAEEKPNLVLNLMVQKEVAVKDAKGKLRTEWKEVRNSEPGEVLKYTITYKNEGKAPARNVTIVDPIPRNTVYIANGATGNRAEITFSLDGSNFQVPPMLKYTVKSGNHDQEFFATPEMYTHIRWKLVDPVPPGGSGWVSFMVKAK